MTGNPSGHRQATADVLEYYSKANKWIKVGQLGKARSNHAVSIVPKETADYCV